MDKNSNQEMPLLTFNSLQNLRLGEMKIKKLQELPELFYEATEEFFNNKKQEIIRLKSEPEKLSREKNILKKSKILLESIIENRCRKIANLAICEEFYGEESISKDNILKKEMTFFETIKKATKQMKKIKMARKYTKQAEKNFLLGINIILISLTIYLIKDIFSLILFSVILAYFLYPLYQYFLKKTNNKRFASLLALSTSIVVLFIPIAILSYFLILNLIKLVVQYSVYLENPEILNAQISTIVGEFSNSSLLANVNFSSIFNSFVSFVVNISKDFFSSVPKFFLFVFVILFIAYYALMHSKEILNSLNEYLPLSLQKQNQLLYRISRNITVLFKGYFLTGIIQTIVALIGYLMFNAPNVLIITFLTLITSLIPYLGTPLVWVPISIYMIISGNNVAGIGLLIYGTVLINLVDNFLRPYLMSDKDTIPPALVFIGFIGGMIAFGISGIILGPLIIAITTIFIKYLIEHYENN